MMSTAISKIKSWIKQSGRFWWFVIKNYIEDDCTYRASALTFTSLLAIVPLMSVSFALLSAFPVFHDLSGPIQDFIFENFVPATGKTIQQYLTNFASQVSKLSIWGVSFLFVTAVLVMFTIEQSLNKIWKVRIQRHGSSAFLLYWAILSLAPVLIGLSIAASSYLISLPLWQKQLNHTVAIHVHYLPALLSLAAFTFLYLIVPNCKVKFIHGLCGATVAAILFELAKQAFAYYLNQFNTYQLLYGAFAIVPIFFLWVYWVWFIVLLGAEVSYAMSVHHHRRIGKKLDGFSHVYHWLFQLWCAQKKGQGLSLEQLIDSDKLAYQQNPDCILETLLKNRLVHSINGNNFILSRDLSQTTLYDLLNVLPYPLPAWETVQMSDLIADSKFSALLKKADMENKKLFNVSLHELFSK